MVAATYPLEVVEAYQWLQRNPGLTGPGADAGRATAELGSQRSGLVVFPDVLKRLNDDVTWTTNLGNAFLAQQQDVMDAVQRMRQRAQQAGKLQSTPQENVSTTNRGRPARTSTSSRPNPDVMYVPVYDPAWIWGPPLWYPYPRWYWPPRSVIAGGLYFGFGGGINVGFFFGGGWHGWGGWGWHPGWGNHTVIVNNTFIHQYNFNTAHIGNVHGTTVWAHDPAHRAGVPYASPALRDQYRGNVRQNRGAARDSGRRAERAANQPANGSAIAPVPQQPAAGAESRRVRRHGQWRGRADPCRARIVQPGTGPQRAGAAGGTGSAQRAAAAPAGGGRRR